jgi:hypothetical protein
MKLIILSIALVAFKNDGYTLSEYLNSGVMTINKFGVDTEIVNKQLPIYHAIPCVDNLLKQVVKANHKYYDAKKYFYSLSLKKEGEKRYLVIEAVQYKSSPVMDYVGAIKVSGAIFLCRGDISIDALLKLNGNNFLNVSLKSAKNADVFNYGMEPTLRGVYQECDKININLEIYTRGTLPGYKME